MSERKPLDLPEPKGDGYTQTVRSLRELIDVVTGRNFQSNLAQEDAGLAEVLPFPFLGLVGQEEMKLALLLAIINPLISGVLLLGPRGTGKTTTARSLVDLLPEIQRSTCFYGCLPEDVESGGIDSICPECARKYAEGISLTRRDRVRLIELPLNAKLDDVIGGLDERAQVHDRFRLKRGILAQADLNLLYVDEVNLLENSVVNALLDASAAGSYTLRRAQIAATYRSRFTLIGSMNPEEGSLRPQIMDRFGLRVIVHGLDDPDQRLEAYWRSRAYRLNPRGTVTQFTEQTQLARDEILTARKLLPFVEISSEVANLGATMIKRVHIDSLRAEFTLFEAARAHAAADARTQVTLQDLITVAPMTLRLRQSPFMADYFRKQDQDDSDLRNAIGNLDLPPEQQI